MAGLIQRGGSLIAVSLVLALADWIAVYRRARRAEALLKPATMLAVIALAWRLANGPHDSWQASFFLPGLGLSLVGDVLIMLPRWGFLAGLAAFLLGHLCYTVGLTPTWPPAAASVFVAATGVAGTVIYTRIARGLRSSGQRSLLLPVALYATVISLMMSAAWTTVLRPEWSGPRRTVVITGATLFYVSDAILAWDRFVRPVRHARLWVMVIYHLGQVMLAASIGRAA
jgi:uncharacterized membrane protein YhhN